jgi:branched-chain amino acid transport system ATP-binding protein
MKRYTHKPGNAGRYPHTHLIRVVDEPSIGLSPVFVRNIFKIIQEINQAGKTILLVEQNANMSLHISSRGYVLETGRIVLSGTGRELTGNPRVKEAYLGG